MIVTSIGGGTGSFHLLLALKRIPDVRINAIVNVSDNGGSTGILRTLYGIVPPGDVRNCLVALSEETEAWTKVFGHRFDEKLDNHSLGNLILTGLAQIYGSFDEALEKAHSILGIKEHKVIPVTYSSTTLCAELGNGKVIKGETEIRSFLLGSKQGAKRFFIEEVDQIFPNPDAIRAIRDSDFLILGPGSLYSSLISNLLVPEIASSVKSSRAKKILVSNIMTEPGEMENETVEAILDEVEKFVKPDIVLINSKKPSLHLLENYRLEKKNALKAVKKDTRYIMADLINEKQILRHDPIKLSRILGWIFMRNSAIMKDS
ncbi:MAG TPA: YvcK family protein [Candidatus Woesearchaeota archaeon]|nr:YvcK family protein [Candidatus Woesearchaeota archaeon]